MSLEPDSNSGAKGHVSSVSSSSIPNCLFLLGLLVCNLEHFLEVLVVAEETGLLSQAAVLLEVSVGFYHMCY